MSESNYDLIVIGGGPAGYPCAIRAAQLGMKALCIDAWINHDGSPAFGGTCLNAGCIPSKALLESSELYHRAQHEFATHGIGIGKVELDLAQLQKRKQAVSQTNAGGVKLLFGANKVTGLFGHGRLLGGGQVEYRSHDGKDVRTLQARHVVIATGSTPVELKIAPFDGERIVDSWGALEFSEVPGRLGVIGAGVIGVELGSVWSRLGAQTVLLEALPDFLPMVDAQIAKEALRSYGKQGLDIRLGARVLGARAGKDAVVVEYEQGGREKVRVVRSPDRRCRSSSVYRWTRCRRSRCGAGCAWLCAGGRALPHHPRRRLRDRRRHRARPNAGAQGHRGRRGAGRAVGRREERGQLRRGPFGDLHQSGSGLGRSFRGAGGGRWPRGQDRQQQLRRQRPCAGDGNGDGHGQVHRRCPHGSPARRAHDRPYVSELVAEAVLALEFGATTEDIQLTMHGHPTLSETFHEAALAVDGHAIHSANKKPSPK
jgi:Pyruvate/2-oxoglutarate dehydrogenase complex, dihydrolipoamide dehydrogenase (E3) component, and related enzymes